MEDKRDYEAFVDRTKTRYTDQRKSAMDAYATRARARGMIVQGRTLTTDDATETGNMTLIPASETEDGFVLDVEFGRSGVVFRETILRADCQSVLL